MKNLILAAALTGSCALLYILYRMKSNSQEKRIHKKDKKDKMRDSTSNLHGEVSKEKIISSMNEEDNSADTSCSSQSDKLCSNILDTDEGKQNIMAVKDKNRINQINEELSTQIENLGIINFNTEQSIIEKVQVTELEFIKLNKESNIELHVQSSDSSTEMEHTDQNIKQDYNKNICHATIPHQVPDNYSAKELVSVQQELAAILDTSLINTSCKSSSSEVLEVEQILSGNEPCENCEGDTFSSVSSETCMPEHKEPNEPHESDIVGESSSKTCEQEQHQESSSDSKPHEIDACEKSSSKILMSEDQESSKPHTNNEETEKSSTLISPLEHKKSESSDNTAHKTDEGETSLNKSEQHQLSDNEPHEKDAEPSLENSTPKLESKEVSSIHEDDVPTSSVISNEDKIITKSGGDKNSVEVPTAKSSKKSKKQKRKEKRALQSKELESCENIEEPQLPEADKSNVKESNNRNCDKITEPKSEVPSETSNSKEGFWLHDKNLESKPCASSPDQLCTSDLERETSQSPEQENVTSDSQSLISQASLDSGQGSLEVDQETVFSNIALPENNSEQYISYHFEVPQLLVGKLIGKRGAFLNKLKSATSTNIIIDNHSNKEYKLCCIEGKKWQVMQTVRMIREHFPIDQFQEFSLSQINNTPLPSPQHQPQMNRQILQVELPPGVVLEVQASAVISTGEVWLQQPLHPTYLALQRLHQCLNLNYEDGSSTPVLPLPIPPNTICVCLIRNQWMRAQVLDHDDTNCTVALLDVGGHMSLPLNLLRQIRVDYISLPFQATQCYLYGIEPVSEDGWEEEGCKALQELVKNNIIYSAIAAYSQDGVPLVNLYQRQYNQYIFINERIVERGHAKWIAAA